MKKRWKTPDIRLSIKPDRPEYTALPARYDPAGKIVRTYPGDPSAVGWTAFIRTRGGYAYLDEPIYETEAQALKFLKEWHATKLQLNRNPCEPRGGGVYR